MIEYRQLGSLGLRVSAVGFGTWGLGGDSYGPAPEVEAISALKAAYARGVNFFDTSDLYGNGRSEEIVAKALGASRKDVIYATKVGFIPSTKEQDFSVTHIEKSLEASLKRLQTDYIDLYQLHSPPLSALSDDLMGALQRMKKSGKVRALGISLKNPNDGKEAIEKYGFECLQVNFNMIDQRPIDNGLFELAKRRNVGVIARTPLCFGFLTGRYSEPMAFSEIDHRTHWPQEQIKKWSEAPLLFSPLYDGGKRSPIEIALQFCLAFSQVSTVIPGMMNSQQVEENLSASDLKLRLSPNDLEVIQAIYKIHFSAPIVKK
jgi:aryl-alcohol dehydrogenase-like predicted oxidoreductase